MNDQETASADPDFALWEDYPELRLSVRRIREGYPGDYWPDLDARGDPSEFVQSLIKSGSLGMLIPFGACILTRRRQPHGEASRRAGCRKSARPVRESYGGAGLPLRAAAVILEEINTAGMYRKRRTCSDVHHGNSNDEQKRRYLSRIASVELRPEAFAVTEPTAEPDTTQR